MVSTFANPLPVLIDKTPVDALFDGGEPASGHGVVIAISETAPGWLRDGATHFFVVVKGGKSGWVKSEYCKFPDLLR
jgi:hypothetical protein